MTDVWQWRYSAFRWLMFNIHARRTLPWEVTPRAPSPR
jgi:hypothetical protein